LKATAKIASTMITMVIELTTEAVVPAPRLCVLGCTRRPQWQPISAIHTPNTMALVLASHRLLTSTALGRACQK